VLYNDLALIENFQVWVTTMSSSAIRPFRHTATVVSLAAVSTLCEIASEIAESTAKSLRQLESEKKKARVNKGRVSALQEKVDEGGQKREIVEGTIKDIFDTVFVHRYRDVDPKIRAECVQALGHWIITLPELFFEGQYLRYLGWVLSDTSPPTRLEVIKQLQRLFKNQNNVGGLRHFIERFRSRLVEMATRDADAGVRASTVELLDSIREAGMLEPDDIDTVGRLIFDSESRVRKAVVGFFAENINDLYDSKVDEVGGEEAIEDVLVGDSDEDFENPRIAWIKLKCLVEVLNSYDSEDREELPSQIERGPPGGSDVLVAAGVESRFSLAAQALYERIPEIREWETLAGYLLFDHSSAPRGNSDDVETALKNACKLDEKEEVILLEVLNAAVRLSLMRSDEQETAKKGKKKKVSKRDSLEHQEAAARHLAQLIPRLLNKFGAVPDAASAVLRLEHVLNLDVFQEPGQESGAYSSLLDNINKQFMTHGDQAVLVEASAALLHARGFEELEEVTEGKVQSLWEDTVSTLHSLVRGKKDVSVRGNLSVNVLTGLSNTVRRLGNLASISDCVEVFEKLPVPTGKKKGASVSEEPLKVLLTILNRANWKNEEEDIGELENELVMGAMKSVLFYFMWKVKALQEKLAEGEEIADVDIDQLQDWREGFISKLLIAIQTRPGTDNLRLAAAGTLLDLYTLFATLRQSQKPKPNADAEATGNNERVFTLIQEITPDLQVLITNTYIAVEKAYARKSRRTLEQAEDDEPIDDEEQESDDEDEDEDAVRERQNQALLQEQKLCELTGKIVLAVIARVLDTTGPEEGKIRERLTRNRGRLGANYKEVVGYLEEKKPRREKKHPATKKTPANKSEERIAGDGDDDGDGDVVMDEAEEGGAEDLRRRELDVEDMNVDVDGDGEEEEDGGGGGGDDYDEIMGD
jgi:cohesin complex subunit SA-1/2